MFFRTNTLWAKIRRVLSPDTWMVKLLNLSVVKEDSARPGTVIIQIDGLSHQEFTRALHKGEMPHLKRLIKSESYTDYVHYSGQPSSTPAVQGELFYGVKSSVPSFSYRDEISGETYNMFNPAHAMEIEKRIKNKGAPLLAGGSAYGDIFTGGAKEAHFCVSAIGWGTLFSAANPVTIAVFTIMHLHIIIRAAFLTVVEIILALYDSLRGYFSGKNLLHEIQYVPFRVISCVIMREVIGVGAKIDIARGLPVIHMNFAGYDEQSHHRGPTSKFAHWSLKAIDSVIRIVWKAAKRSSHRDYEVMIYSDHGQEETVYYGDLYGKPVQEAINEVLKLEVSTDGLNPESVMNGGYLRASMMREVPAKTAGAEMRDNIKSGKYAVITALGPMGHIYTPKKLSSSKKEKIARTLVTNTKIPLVLVSSGRGRAIAWNDNGKFLLPRDAIKVLGENHPFLKETAKDLVELCAHKGSGGLIFSGLRDKGKYITFYNERGSHGGPGPLETAGFALLPADMDLPTGKNINNAGLREAFFRSLNRGRGEKSLMSKVSAPVSSSIELKIMSYNVHACKGADGKVSPERIAEVIAAHNPDIVALQEIDSRDNVHQAKVIADLLSMNFYYHSSVMLKTGLHGNAIMSRFDLKLIKRGSLPNLARTPFLEKRGIIWAEINAYGRKLQIINTHLSLFQPEGMMQAKYLLEKDWLGAAEKAGPVIMCGDFNSHINSRIYKAIGRQLKSINFHATGYKHLRTFPSLFPIGLVDHIFLSEGVRALDIEAPKTGLERMASDHLPLIVNVRVEAKKAVTIS